MTAEDTFPSLVIIWVVDDEPKGVIWSKDLPPPRVVWNLENN